MTAKIMKEIESIKVTLATAMAEKLGWKPGVAAVAFVLTLMGGGYLDLKGEINQVDTMVDKTHELAVRNSEKIEQTRQIAIESREIARESREIALSNSETLKQILFIVRQGADPETLGALNNLFNDTSIDTPDDATSNPPSDTSSDAGEAVSKINLDSPSELRVYVSSNACYITPSTASELTPNTPINTNTPINPTTNPTKENINV